MATAVDAPPRQVFPETAPSDAGTPLDALLQRLKLWGSAAAAEQGSGQGVERQPSNASSRRTAKRSGTSMRSFKRAKRSAGLASGLEEGGIGQSPVFRSPRTDKISFSTSRRSSAGSSWSSGSGYRRSGDGYTPATSVAHSSLASPKMGGRGRSGSTRPALVADATQPVTLDLYQAPRSTLPDVATAQGSFVAALGMQSLPTPKYEGRSERRPAPMIFTTSPSQPEGLLVPATTTVPPPLASPVSTVKPGLSRDDAAVDPRLLRPSHVRRRSRSMSDLRISLQPSAETLQSGGTARPGTAMTSRSALRSFTNRGRSPLGRGPVIFEPADVTCETWLAPRPRLVGHYTETAQPQFVARSDRSALTSVERRAAAARAQHRASRIARHRDSLVSSIHHDPRLRSQPLGGWSAQSGLAEPASPPVGTSFEWAVKGWRSPRKPRTRTIATQTPGGEAIAVRPRSASVSAVPQEADEGFVPKPRKRASSLSYYHESLRRDVLDEPLSPTLAEPLKRAQSAYPPGTPEPISLVPAPRRRGSKPGTGSRPSTGQDSRPSTGEAAVQTNATSRIAGASAIVLSPRAKTPTLGGEQQVEAFRRSESAPLPSATSTDFTRETFLPSESQEDSPDIQDSDFTGLFFIPPSTTSLLTGQLSTQTFQSSRSSRDTATSERTVFRGIAVDGEGDVVTAHPSFASSDILPGRDSDKDSLRQVTSTPRNGLNQVDLAAVPRIYNEPRLQEMVPLRAQLMERNVSEANFFRADAAMVTAPSSPVPHAVERPLSELSAESWLNLDDMSPTLLPGPRFELMEAVDQHRSSFLEVSESPDRGREAVGDNPSGQIRVIEFDLEDNPPLVVPPVTPASTRTTPHSSVHHVAEEVPPLPSSSLGSSLHSPIGQRHSHASSGLSPNSADARDSGSFRSRLSLEAFPAPPPSSRPRSSFPPIGEEPDRAPPPQPRTVSRSLDADLVGSGRYTLSVADWLEMDSPERSTTVARDSFALRTSLDARRPASDSNRDRNRSSSDPVRSFERQCT